MSDAASVLILDDNPTTTTGSIHHLLAESGGDAGRFTIDKLTDPALLGDHLDRHAPAVVVVDVDFELTGTGVTCLTAFRTLARRHAEGRPTPYCVGLSTSEHGRTLFPFAVCQLLPSVAGRLVGWAYKDEDECRGYQRLIGLLDLIGQGRPLPSPAEAPGLARCWPGDSGAGSLIRRILKNTGDVKLWRYLSTAHYDAQDLAHLASISKSSVYSYFDRYRQAISDFQASMADDTFHPRSNLAALHVSESSRSDPRQRIIEAFAQTHRRFFQANELEQIVKEVRTGRRVSGAWMTSNPLSVIGRARRRSR